MASEGAKEAVVTLLYAKHPFAQMPFDAEEAARIVELQWRRLAASVEYAVRQGRLVDVERELGRYRERLHKIDRAFRSLRLSEPGAVLESDLCDCTAFVAVDLIREGRATAIASAKSFLADLASSARCPDSARLLIPHGDVARGDDAETAAAARNAMRMTVARSRDLQVCALREMIASLS